MQQQMTAIIVMKMAIQPSAAPTAFPAATASDEDWRTPGEPPDVIVPFWANTIENREIIFYIF